MYFKNIWRNNANSRITEQLELALNTNSRITKQIELALILIPELLIKNWISTKYLQNYH